MLWHLADVTLNPNINALPGGGTLQTLTNGLGAWALIAALAGLVIGAAAWALGVHAQNFQQSMVGRRARSWSRAWPRCSSVLRRPLSTSSSTQASTSTEVRLVLATGCPGIDALNPVCQAGSAASAGFESVLGDISQWVASGAEWLLAQVGDVLTSTTTVDVGAAWFQAHYGAMTALAGVVILPLLLLSTLQAVLRRDPGQLVRSFLVQLPLALLLGVVAVQIVVLCLSATDAMSDAVAGGTGADVTSLLSGLTTGLAAAAADPTVASFVLLLLALLVAVAAFVLWLELLIRAAAVYVAVLFLPLALATLVWPAVSHWCRRLVETLAALVLSKFVIVATLSLAAGAVASGTAGTGDHGSGFSSVLAGGALLVIATFVPFAILRMIPAVEAGAVGHLEGLRQRGTGAMTRVARSAAQHALGEGLQALGSAWSAGGGRRRVGRPVGFGFGRRFGRRCRATTSGGPSTKLTERGENESPRIIEEVLSGRRPAPPPRPKGPKPIIGSKPEDEEGGEGGEQNEQSDNVPTAAAPAPWRSPMTRARTFGPTGPEDAWMWEGVPPGAGLIGTPEPGKMRWYMGRDEHGPQYKWLPGAWPPGQKPEEEA